MFMIFEAFGDNRRLIPTALSAQDIQITHRIRGLVKSSMKMTATKASYGVNSSS
jgi:hypothetical protein